MLMINFGSEQTMMLVILVITFKAGVDSGELWKYQMYHVDTGHVRTCCSVVGYVSGQRESNRGIAPGHCSCPPPCERVRFVAAVVGASARVYQVCPQLLWF